MSNIEVGHSSIDKITQVLIEKATLFADNARERRIEKIWRKLISGLGPIGNKQLKETLPVLCMYRAGSFQLTDQYISIPLKSNDGDCELKIGLFDWDDCGEKNNDNYSLMLGITAPNNRGVRVEYPYAMIPHSWFNYDPPLSVVFIDRQTGREFTRDECDKLSPPVMNFMALFDPKRDIDFEKLGTPTDAQKLCLKALKVPFPPK